MRSLAFVITLAVALPVAAAEPSEVKRLWPGKAPGEMKDLGPEKYLDAKPGQSAVKRLTNVSDPTIAIYPAPKDKATGCAVVVAPGGGFSILAIEHEGTMTCEWLQSIGVTAILLKYRVPTREMQMPTMLAAIQDGQRAMSLVRANATVWGIDPNRIGMLGFSAGGQLTAWTCLSTKRYYDPIDKADDVPFQPNFAMLIYAGGLIDKGGALKPEFTVTKDAPPMFFVHATNDNSENSVALYAACKKANVPAEMHLYASGGHGFGMNKIPHPAATWPERAAEWMTARGYLKK